jgi:uncharacterized membrane protein YkvA (DUF1232 family)
LAARDPRVPWYAKLFAAAIAAYALSPIDLIPDFIPVLGYLDEVILLPLAIMLAIRMIPADVMVEHRAAAVKAEATPTLGWRGCDRRNLVCDNCRDWLACVARYCAGAPISSNTSVPLSVSSSAGAVMRHTSR